MKIFEFTYPDGSHSYSTTSGCTLTINNIEPISSDEYEVDGTMGMNFLENPDQYKFDKGVINAKS